MARTLVRRVGARIREFRERARLSQVALAQRARIGRATLRRIEDGTHGTTLTLLERLARALKVGARDLLPGRAKRTKKGRTR